MLKIICVVTLILNLASGQSLPRTRAEPEFDAVSVKPSKVDPRGHMLLRGGPATPEPGQITWTTVPLIEILRRAYGVRNFQVSGPDWLETQGYDIVAKVPMGTTPEVFSLMLQTMLKERFGCSLHFQTKEGPAYALIVGKDGPKMKASSPEPARSAEPNRDASANEPRPPKMALGPDGFPVLKQSGPHNLRAAIINGMARTTFPRTSMGEFAAFLTDEIGKPVADSTGLSGRFDFTLSWVSERQPYVAPGLGPPPGAAPASEPGPTIFGAVQQLGLKLQARSAPFQMLVIDHIARVPTAN